MWLASLVALINEQRSLPLWVLTAALIIAPTGCLRRSNAPVLRLWICILTMLVARAGNHIDRDELPCQSLLQCDQPIERQRAAGAAKPAGSTGCQTSADGGIYRHGSRRPRWRGPAGAARLGRKWPSPRFRRHYRWLENAPTALTGYWQDRTSASAWCGWRRTQSCQRPAEFLGLA